MYKVRFLNKYVLLSVFSLISLLIISYGVESNYFELMFWGGFSALEKSHLKGSVMNWNMFFYTSNAYTVLFYPVFASLPIMMLRLETTTLLTFSYPRLKSYRRTIIKLISIYSFIGGLVVFLGYLFFILYGAYIGLETTISSYGVLDMALS